MALTPEIRAPQGGSLATIRIGTQEVRVPQTDTLVTYNIPTEEMKLTAGSLNAAFRQDADINVTGAGTLAAVKGRVSNFRLRAWTFTLDGHDFYVLRLGETATLVYDVYSEQWIEWTDFARETWRPNVGMRWIGATGLGADYGSSIVFGDDTFGLLWFLDPKQPYDQHPDYLNANQQRPFERIVTGQLLAKGRQHLPCYVAFLDGDNYGLSGAEFTASIVLEISDDQGQTFTTLDALPIQTDLTVENPYAWYSLGQISSPGRLFRITDTGVLSRIDSLTVNDDAG